MFRFFCSRRSSLPSRLMTPSVMQRCLYSSQLPHNPHHPPHMKHSTPPPSSSGPKSTLLTKSNIVEEAKSDASSKQPVTVPSEGVSSSYMLREMMKYIWPKGEYRTKFRVVGAVTLLFASKVLLATFSLLICATDTARSHRTIQF